MSGVGFFTRCGPTLVSLQFNESTIDVRRWTCPPLDKDGCQLVSNHRATHKNKAFLDHSP